MKIHHLNCSTFCPYGGHFMDGVSPGIGEAQLVCHCLLIESNNGLILIDTGLGMKDVYYPEERMSGFFRNILRPKLMHEETAIFQIRQLGYDVHDVRHIILTHLDFDHAGGIDDFPNAQVHLLEAESRAAQNSQKRSFVTRNRYSPPQFRDIKTWNTYDPHGEKWFGFESVRSLVGLPPEILLIPLIGHTEGHAGVAINTDQGWLLHAGDAYFYRDEMNIEYACTPGLRGYQKMMEVNRKMRLFNQRRLRNLALTHRDEVKVFSAHDALEFEALKNSETRNLLVHSEDNFHLWDSGERPSELDAP